MPIFPHQDITIGQPTPLDTSQAKQALARIRTIMSKPKAPGDPGFDAEQAELRRAYVEAYGDRVVAKT